jgi:hypothetical protein
MTADDRHLRRDLRTLARFVDVYCTHKHPDAAKAPARLKTHDVEAIHGRPLTLCPDCTRLLTHAFVKRTACPFDPKPACKHCPDHCYQPTYRRRIRKVMKFSGRQLVLSGRLDYLYKLLF